MEEYWFLAPMSRLAIFSASFEYFFSETFHNNLLVARAKQLVDLLRVRRRQSYLITDWAEKFVSMAILFLTFSLL